MIERIVNEAQQLALILRRDFRRDGIEFITADDDSLQLGYMNRPQGYVVQPHVHNPVARAVSYTKEVLFIKSGRVRVDFYSQQQQYLESRVLYGGDVVLLSYGGHGFEMLEPTEIIEVKQGPYVGDQDKTRFVGEVAARIQLKGDPT
jgi:mannose-6-phosphate isomerase-like protein (cupin superfamily)